MKPNAVTCLLLIFCVMNLFFGCSQRKAAPLPELERAEAVMFDHPDSALRILQRMPKPTDKEQHALWCLLMTQARYKQYLPIPSDSLIRIAYDYYKPTDDARRKAMAALYMGGVNYELKNIEEATAYYLEAKNEVEGTDDYALRYLVMSGLGSIYLYRGLADYALEVCQKAYDYATETPYFNYKADALRSIARVYHVKNKLDSAIVYYDKAIIESHNAKLLNVEQRIKGELAGIYINKGEYSKALELQKDEKGQYYISAQSLYCIGTIYMNQEKYDSAYFYLTQALINSNVYTRRGVYRNLLRLSYHPQYQKYMIGFNDSLRLYEDSVQKLDKSKEIIIYRGKYEKEKLLTEKQQLELEKANALRWLLVSVIVILCLAAWLVYHILHQKVQFHKKKEESNKLILQVQENKLRIDRNDNYIAELNTQKDGQGHEIPDQQEEQEEMLASLHQENEMLHKKIARLSASIESRFASSQESADLKKITEQLRQTKQQQEEWLVFIQREHPFLSGLHQRKACLNHEEMQTVYFLVDALFNKFSKRLKQAVPSLSQRDMELCCLIKLRFAVSEIAVLMGISPSSVSTNKHRAKQKIYDGLKVEAQNKSLDLWLWEY